MPQPEDTQVDYVVRQCLYWPDGKRKKRFNVDERRDRRRLLVQALVDKYNDYIGVGSLVLLPAFTLRPDTKLTHVTVK
jgi:hypothetical protein